MQCKDVPDAPVLRFLSELNGRLAGWHDLQPRADYCPTVVDAMPPGTPEKVVLAKMRTLVRRGLARGCCCGCRGDFRITPRGQEWLDAGRETPNAEGNRRGVMKTRNERSTMSHLDEVARRKVNGPEGWAVCAWERIGNDLVVTGGVPRLLKAGPRKGESTWRDVPTQKVVVTEAEIDAEKARYEADTGKCSDCMGKGDVLASWSVAEGIKYRPCKRCGGTGKPPNAQVICAGGVESTDR